MQNWESCPLAGALLEERARRFKTKSKHNILSFKMWFEKWKVIKLLKNFSWKRVWKVTNRQLSLCCKVRKGIFYPFWLKFRLWKANSDSTVHKVAWSIQSSSSQCAKREYCNILFDFVTMTIVGPLRSLALLCQSYLSRTYLMSHKLGNSTKNPSCFN